MTRAGRRAARGRCIEFTMKSSRQQDLSRHRARAGHVRHARPEQSREAERHHQPPAPVHAQGRGLRPEAIRAGHGGAVHRRRGRARPAAVHGARQPDRAEAGAGDDRDLDRQRQRRRPGQPARARIRHDVAASTRSSSRRKCCRWSRSKCNVKLTKDPDGRATMGCSSGGSCAIIMAWYHPELYHRVLTLLGHVREPAVAAQPRDAAAARGSFTSTLIPNSPAKPLRIWMEVGDRDLLQPERHARRHARLGAGEREHGQGAGGQGLPLPVRLRAKRRPLRRGDEAATLPEALEYVWQGYKGGGGK